MTAVFSGGYATAPNYPETVVSVMQTIFHNGGGPSFDVVIDEPLNACLERLRSVPFGKERRAQLEIEMKTLLGKLPGG